MTTTTRLLPVNFTVPEGFGHHWVITHRADICVMTGVQGREQIAISSGHFDLACAQVPKKEQRHAHDCFERWLDESVAEMRKMCEL